MAIKMTIAFGDNPRVDPMRDGTVKPEGIDLEVLTVEGGMLFYRNLANDEFDASEMSMSETLVAMERKETVGKGKWDWSSLPVFLGRGHPWPNFYVRNDSGINSPADLKGKRIGYGDYDQTSAVWLRCHLKDFHGIEASDNSWWNGRTKELSHGGGLGLHLPGHEVVGVEHHWLTADQTLDQMLDNGELDASGGIRRRGRVTAGDASVIDRYGGTQVDGNPNFRLLMPDAGQQAVYDYYRQTGFFHANHHVIVQNRILREHPWVALELYKAFERSKEVAYERAREASAGYLYFPENAFKDQDAALNGDPFPMGIQKMGKNIERIIQSNQEAGLLTKPLKLEDVYFSTMMDT